MAQIPSYEELDQKIRKILKEVAGCTQAEKESGIVNGNLDQQLEEYTADLRVISDSLETEIARRELAERELLERKHVEESLQEKEYIIESSSSMIATADLQGNMTYVNPAFLRAWRFDDAEDFFGRPFWDFWVVEHRLDEIMETFFGKGTWFGEIKAKRKDGSLFDVQVLAALVSDKEGNPVGLTSTSLESSERRQTEEELREGEQFLSRVISQDCFQM